MKTEAEIIHIDDDEEREIKSSDFHMRVAPSKRDRWRRAARKDGRTMTNWIEHTLDEASK